MANLSAKDLRAALDFLADAYSFDDVESFRTGILPGLQQLIPSDLVGYNEVYSAAEAALVITHPEPMLPFAGEALALFAHQHPLISVQMNGDTAAYKISDFLTRREFRSLELYNDLYRVIGAEDQIACGLPGPMVIGVAMNRDRRAFSERDRAMLDLLRPHLARAHRQAQERIRNEALLAALERGLAEHDGAVLALDDHHGVLAASGTALSLLGDYFPGERVADLPVDLVAWLEASKAGREAEPLTVTGPRGRLTILLADATGETLLALKEERAVTTELLRRLGLTRRQAEVLRLLVLGSSVDGVAEALFISPLTVRKHLEHIYARLGVHSRAEAVAAALAVR